MLYPAQLYKDELRKKLISCWYDPKYRWYFGGEFNEFSVEDNAYWRQDFVHLDSEGSVDGFFSYNYNDSTKSLTNFGLVSFSSNGAALVMDALSRVKYMFERGAQRCEFWAFADNPACKLYDLFAKRYGGEMVGRLHRTAYFDGVYHDTVFYEFLVENYRVKHHDETF